MGVLLRNNAMSSFATKSDILFKFFMIVSVVAITVLTFKIATDMTLLTRRVDALESRPMTATVSTYTPPPEAGASGLIKPTPTITPTASGVPTVSPAPTATSNPATTRQTTYIPLQGVTTTTLTEWVDASGTDSFLDVSVEYGKNAYISWEANVSVQAGSGEARVRLFDVTHGVAVPGSEISGTSGTPSLIQSGKVTLLSGNNRYRVQLQSKTSTSVTFHSGRIKIVY